MWKFLPLAALAGAREIYDLNQGWKFSLEGGAGYNCTADTFPIDLGGAQCFGLTNLPYVTSSDGCRAACCGDDACGVWQWCPAEGADCSAESAASCWTGGVTNVSECAGGSGGWAAGARASLPPAPAPGGDCDARTTPECAADFDDASWRELALPHDFVVEGNFSADADMAHGYLPFGRGWYRKTFELPASAAGASVSVEFEGVMCASTVWLNGVVVAAHASGYTPFSADLANVSGAAVFGGTNVLAVLADATKPDGWWYDGGGIYRSVRLVVAPAHARVARYGVYAPALVVGNITRGDGGATSTADAVLAASVELENSAGAATDNVALSLRVVRKATGALVASATAAPAGGVLAPTVPGAPLSVPCNISLPGAALWSPSTPELYALEVTLAVGAAPVDTVNVTFGVRKTAWSADGGFSLNDAPTKILGCANHQDFAGLGVAVPDALQRYRVRALQALGANAWRTAHNAPNPALLDACDEEGMLVWDENHRNGQPAEAATLARRDRNHPSIVLWSVCNEVLCDAGGGTSSDASRAAAEEVKAAFREHDPLGGRLVSANQNDWITNDTALDVIGYDYATGSYDAFHAATPSFPAISSETSSAVGDLLRCRGRRG